MCSFFSNPEILSSKADCLIFWVRERTSWTFTSASIKALCKSFIIESTIELSRKIAFAILFVVLFKTFESFSNIFYEAERRLINLWFFMFDDVKDILF